jgi:hypothetical protein
MTADREHQKRLIDAANLLCDEVRDNLPDGWEISLVMNKDEAYLSLTNPDGDDTDYDGGEHNYSSITAACDQAKYIDALVD